MAKIRQLEPHVADLIAAGEVVERPASVIKELAENAIDAGATLITVEIRGGGLTFIRVTDNGGGIEPADAETAFLRHATSKLRDERGLEAISTLGFRGEALAAIAAVSKVQLLSRVQGAEEGIRLTLEGGVVTEKVPAGCPEGTTLIVRDLFYNTPARLKFMKSDRAEAAAISALMTSCALSHPEISFRYIRDGKEEFHTPGDGRVESAIYTLFGRDFAAGMLPASSEDEGLTVSGYVCAPHKARGNRSYQFFFVNGRAVRSKTLQAALEQAYRNSLFTGRFPSCVLYLTMRWSEVDVNVHPAKIEVKFLSERKVFDGVYYAALSALSIGSPIPSPTLNAPKPAPTEKADAPLIRAEDATTDETAAIPTIFIPTHPEQSRPAPIREGNYSGYRSALPKGSGGASFRGYEKPVAWRHDKKPLPDADEKDNTLRDLDEALPEGLAPLRGEGVVQISFPEGDNSAPSGLLPDAPGETVETTASSAQEESSFRYVGEAYGTYIIVEQGESLWLIDKHAAHERMHFDRLKSRDYEPMAQILLQPVICRLGREDTALLFGNGEMFARLGFLIEPFGEESVAVRQIPSDISQQDTEATLAEILDVLRRGGKPDTQSRLDSMFHTIACKAAVKAGKISDPQTLSHLIANVLTGKVRYCPHGRPVAMEWTKSAIDRSFKRT
jgi:DNA mismatch repair protein MutL